MTSFKQRIAEMLIERKLTTQEQLDASLAESAQNGKNLAQVLIERGVLSESQFMELLSHELGLPAISLTKYKIDPEASKLIPERLARRYNLVALAKFGERLVVAMADPMNIFAIDDLKALTQIAIDPVLSPESEIRRTIEQVYPGQNLAADVKEQAALTSDEDGNLDTEVALLLRESGEKEAPVVRVINRLVIEAIHRRASDIHLEPAKDWLRIRYRIDGHLVEAHRLPKAIQSLLLTRLKIMSRLDITEWRLPQDGRFKVRVGEERHEVDFRVSILPVTHGNKVVLRVLDKASLTTGLESLGLSAQAVEQIKAAAARPYGMILVTGPTGSGKSTTLYSVLHLLTSPTKNLVTVEDPVEYQLEGVTQVHVNPEVGLTFAAGLRSILRQSPDVVMIGEIRDFETADIAMKASLTGQLVLSTLHTNDAPSAITRLIDMGVEPFLIASGINLIEAQRLVRKLCTKCRERFDPAPAALEHLGLSPQAGAAFFRPRGCRVCNDTGYRGRMSIAELFLVDEGIRALIVSRAHSWEIRDYAVKTLGMTPLRTDGFAKAQQGLTTLEEVIAATSEE
jgi:type IV pilus assembly protein PilB